MPVFHQTIYTDQNLHDTLSHILIRHNVQKYLLVCGDHSYHSLNLEKLLSAISIPYIRFGKFSPNPIYEDVTAGVKLVIQEKCDFIVAIGGGSAIDTAKCIRLFSELNHSENYLTQPYLPPSIPMAAIPTTAGTGSESTQFAVIYYNNEKQSVSTPDALPEYVILEPSFLESLSIYQKKSTLLDALCQCIESIWSVNSTDESRAYAKEGIQIILENIIDYLNNQSDARKNMLIAANKSGQAINLSQTTAAHAMSYKLTALYGISHGHAVACCLPYIWRHINRNIDKCSDTRGESHLRAVLDELNQLFCSDITEEAVCKFEEIFEFLDMDIPHCTNKLDLDTLTNSVNIQRLGNTPVPLSAGEIRAIYSDLLDNKKKL